MRITRRVKLAWCVGAAIPLIYYVATGAHENPEAEAVWDRKVAEKEAAKAAWRSGSFERPEPGTYEYRPPEAPANR